MGADSLPHFLVIGPKVGTTPKNKKEPFGFVGPNFGPLVRKSQEIQTKQGKCESILS